MVYAAGTQQAKDAVDHLLMAVHSCAFVELLVLVRLDLLGLDSLFQSIVDLLIVCQDADLGYVSHIFLENGQIPLLGVLASEVYHGLDRLLGDGMAHAYRLFISVCKGLHSRVRFVAI